MIKANLERPHDVICHNGSFIITSTYNNRIVEVRAGNSSFCSLYIGDCNFHPYGIVAVSDDLEDHFLITDDGRGKGSKGCVYELKNGSLREWASQYRSFDRPTGIAICEKEVFVADWGAGCIHVFNKSGAFLRCIAEVLTKPWFLAFNSQNLLYVADLNCIRVFRTDGTSKGSFKIGTANKSWNYRGIAFDAYDNVYITARSTDSKLLFTKETLSVLDKNHMALDNIVGGWRTFNYLRGLCIDKNKGRVVVVDGEWHELKLFNLH